ncbi:Spc19-domain-containing protein [Phycomyces blakesleeanus]|uniref:DASH complex subunit SPC19 n=1 Tax=Phycomyces blakesleeanus TaxID=4837 RepID=A0ABR3APD7_PHYBL
MSNSQRLPKTNDQLKMQDKRHNSMSMLENLESSATSMRSITNSLSISTNLLKSSLKGFDRILKNTEFKRTHELITEADIQMSQSSIASDMLPQLKALVDHIEIRLDKTVTNKKNLQRQVNLQDDKIKSISEERSKYNKSQLTQNGVQKSKVEKKRRMLEVTKESKQLQAKKAKLMTSMEQMDIDALEKQRALQNIEQDIKDTKRLSETVKNADNATSLKNLGMEQQRLQNELQKLKEKAKQSKLRLIKERQKSNEAQSHDIVASQTKMNNMERYDDEKWIVQEDQCLEHYQRSLENILNLLNKVSDPSFKASATIIDTFKHQKTVYLQSVEKDQDMINSVIIPNCETHEKHMLEKFIIKCKLLMPESAMAVTVVRVLETMLKRKHEQDRDPRMLSEILLERFPPRDERRHSFKRVVSILKNAGIIELLPDQNSSSQIEDAFYHCSLSRHL